MDVSFFNNFDFFTGVPDSQLKALCNYLMCNYGISNKHIIAANEGNCVGIAAGYYLSTGKVPVVYLQNSGIGNIINPVASMLNDNVYGIPVLFVVGWRGEPDIHDEPQHIYQGKVTIKLLEDMDIKTYVINSDTSVEELKKKMDEVLPLFKLGKSVALVVRKGGLTFKERVEYKNNFSMPREEIIKHIVKYSKEDIVISTTGKASRELFEIREQNKQSHQYDFLTVGSMGHSSSIALGIALQKKHSRVWCIDGDGAALMHLGAMAVIGANKPSNLIHIVLNNRAHETVGGMPTVSEYIDFLKIAEGCGYPVCLQATDFESLNIALAQAVKSQVLVFIEVKTALGSREDLGRPTTTAQDNRKAFMNYLNTLN